MPKITSRDEAQAYLETQETRRVLSLGARCCLRALPAVSEETEADFEEVALAVSQVALIASVKGRSHPKREALIAYPSISKRLDGPNVQLAAVASVRFCAAVTESLLREDNGMAGGIASSAANASGNLTHVGSSDVQRDAVAAAYEAFSIDTDASVPTDLPIWHSGEPPTGTSLAIKKLQERWRHRDWSFWRRWYQGFLDGQPLDWELQRRVALIPDADWQKGAAHIAELIREIERDHLAETRKRYHEQAQRLIARKASTLAISDGLSRMIRAAVDAYKAELGHPNTEQPILEPLEKLALLFGRVSGAFELEQPEDALTELITAMAGTIAEFNQRLTRAQAQCKSNAARVVKTATLAAVATGVATGTATVISQEAVDAFTAPELWGAILSGTDYIIGETSRTVDYLAELTSKMMGAEADPRPEDWLACGDEASMSEGTPDSSPRPEIRPPS